MPNYNENVSLMQQLRERLADGGFSIYNDWSSPTSGFVSSAEGCELQVKMSEFQDDLHRIDDTIFRYIIKNIGHLLSDSNHVIGGWIDSGILYLDCSIVFADEIKCREFAIDNNQLAYYDVVNKDVIETGIVR